MSTVIDIKTGRAEAWCSLQTAAQSLLNNYSVAFEKEGHVYTAAGKVLPSITQILQAEGFVDTSHYDEWSRDKGSMVHLAIHYYVNNELEEDYLDPEIVPYLNAFKKFLADSGFKVERSEVPACNLTYGYAGTPDLVGCFPKPTAARRFVLEVNKDAKYKLIAHTDQQDFNIWLACVAVHKWKANHRR
jgi:hypothetical protein